MRKSKLKSDGSPSLSIKNARLLGRSGISVDIAFGEVKVVESDAFNPALAIQQLMKQSLARINRTDQQSDFSWHVDFESLNFAVQAEIFKPLLIDLEEQAEADTVRSIETEQEKVAAELEALNKNITEVGSEGSLVLVGVSGSAISMSFRLDVATISEKLSEIVGELTRDGTERSQIAVKLFPDTVKTRKELESANPIAKFALSERSIAPAKQALKKQLKELSLGERFRIGLDRWAKRTSARLLIVDGASNYLSEIDFKVLVEHLKKIVGSERMCLLLNDTRAKLQPLTTDQLEQYDRLQIEFKRKLSKARVIDWIGNEDEIAKLFAQLPDARRNGLTEKDFIRNVTRYRCPVCDGDGFTKSHMGPFGEIRDACTSCSMSGFGDTVAQVRYKEITFRELLSRDHIRLGDSLALLSETDGHTLRIDRIGNKISKI